MAARGFIELLRLSEMARQRKQTGESSQADRWSGVAFLIESRRFVAPLGEISEVLTLPEITTVPGTHKWLRGLSNVRGRLLPITELAMFCGIDNARSDSRRKVMVIDQEVVFGGLIVDEVLGIQHFSRQQYIAKQGDAPLGIRPFLQGYFQRDGTDWHVFLPSMLARDPQYLNASQS